MVSSVQLVRLQTNFWFVKHIFNALFRLPVLSLLLLDFCFMDNFFIAFIRSFLFSLFKHYVFKIFIKSVVCKLANCFCVTRLCSSVKLRFAFQNKRIQP